MANYNSQKVFAELGKLDEKELYEQFLEIKSFVQKVLQEKQKQREDEASELQSKIEKL